MKHKKTKKLSPGLQSNYRQPLRGDGDVAHTGTCRTDRDLPRSSASALLLIFECLKIASPARCVLRPLDFPAPVLFADYSTTELLEETEIANQ